MYVSVILLVALLLAGLVAVGWACCRLCRGLFLLRQELRDLQRQRGACCHAWAVEACRNSPNACGELASRLVKSLAFFRKLEASTPESERWKLKRPVIDGLADRGLVPTEYRLHSEVVLAQLDLLRQMKHRYHENGVADPERRIS